MATDPQLSEDEQYEQELEAQLAEIDAREAETSTPDTAEDTELPEDSGNKQPDASKATDADIKPDEPGDAQDEGKAPSKATDDDSDDEQAKSNDTVPIERLSQVSRERQQALRKARELEDENKALKKRLDSASTQAKLQGFELSDGEPEVTEEDLQGFVDEFGERAGRIMYQNAIDIQELKARNANADVPQEDDPVFQAVEQNNDAYRWFVGSGEGQKHADNWNLFKQVYGEHEAELERNYSTEVERINRAVELTKARQKELAKEKIDAEPNDGTPRNLNNIPGKSDAPMDEIDELMAMGDKAIDAIDRMPQAKQERIYEQLRNRRI